MQNKVCGECVHYDKKLGLCDSNDNFFTIISNTPACLDFEIKPPMTNGDRIRQMSNEEMAVMFKTDIKQCPPGECHDDGCIECWLEWLNTEVGE